MARSRYRSRAAFLCSALLPGLLAAIHLAGLVLFLNPELPLTAGGLTRASLRFALPLSLVSLLLHLLIPPLRRAACKLLSLPWTLTAVFAAAATGAATNASRFAFYLPPGVNERLLRAALWLGLAALIGFYTALLHSLHRRRYGQRSRALYALLVLLSIYAVVERRHAAALLPVTLPPVARLTPAPPPQIVVVSLPGGGLELLLPLAEQGQTLFLKSILETGAVAALEAPTPFRTAPAWGSLITGKLPFQHGVLSWHRQHADVFAPGGELRLLPWGFRDSLWRATMGTSRALQSGDLAALPVWRVLPRLDLRTALVGVPLASPLPPEVRWVVPAERLAATPLAADVPTSPPELSALVDLFRIVPAELTPEVRAALGPGPLAEALAGDLWRRDLARRLLVDRPELDLLWVHLPGLARAVEETYGGFAGALLEGRRNNRQRAAARELVAYGAELDRILASLWEAIPRGDRLLLLVSPSGAEGPNRRERFRAAISQRPPLGGRLGGRGALVLYGAGGRDRSEPLNARGVDLVPTLYYLYGVPVPRDLDGRVLIELFPPAFLAARPLAFVPTYETLPPPSGR